MRDIYKSKKLINTSKRNVESDVNKFLSEADDCIQPQLAINNFILTLSLNQKHS